MNGKITDEEVLSTELHMSVELYLKCIDRIENAVIACLDMSEQSDELERVRQKFKALFREIRQGSFEEFKQAILKGSANHDAKIN